MMRHSNRRRRSARAWTARAGARAGARAMRLAAPVAAVAIVAGTQPTRASIVYWDLNGTNTGATSSLSFDVSGTWNSTNTFFNNNSAGTTTAPHAWVQGDTPVFSAGTNGIGTSTITVVGSKTVAGMTFEEGTLTLSGDPIAITSGSLSATGSASVQINDNISTSG